MTVMTCKRLHRALLFITMPSSIALCADSGRREGESHCMCDDTVESEQQADSDCRLETRRFHATEMHRSRVQLHRNPHCNLREVWGLTFRGMCASLPSP
ncbi:hypothetical protein BO82DRAFT_167105 [Aspergillus uvarum CBS 121591]|uniref:Extracellular membrane protein CFEM domain-containing protein n=1 Tax=Aspergillus uvarum CBS 121591 TaxID=1448315 RepID=A0A319C2K2_9EURO|nr:hypothetical protein BO82DRAFT_167105 [Aspergillus uvarum CBS 121591]PYH78060.1 hypothetical protein BO82DRAFT_167105 [Aspergillus uvarum CBS 121591]